MPIAPRHQAMPVVVVVVVVVVVGQTTWAKLAASYFSRVTGAEDTNVVCSTEVAREWLMAELKQRSAMPQFTAAEEGECHAIMGRWVREALARTGKSAW
ncbi:hypothetical protein E2C01_063746 [Portunus trituberculatus]|uniref:Uncharacterized protein n=1 Tax=Portunus trituberculatus TaxID=210409 RepID=A0A5B7HIH2_PORTR|nr:hypothetical protein [Portunus trituberculatus]